MRERLDYLLQYEARASGEPTGRGADDEDWCAGLGRVARAGLEPAGGQILGDQPARQHPDAQARGHRQIRGLDVIRGEDHPRAKAGELSPQARGRGPAFGAHNDGVTVERRQGARPPVASDVAL